MKPTPEEVIQARNFVESMKVIANAEGHAPVLTMHRATLKTLIEAYELLMELG